MSARILATSLLTIALATGTSAYAQDSDADGFRDAQDGFPCDSSAVGEAFAPGQGVHGLLIFEDKWPLRADTDFNDLVLSYNYAAKTNAAGLTTAIRATFNVLALGGVYDNGLSLHLPIATQSVASVTLEVPGGAVVQLTPSTLDAEFTVDLSNNLRTFFSNQTGAINSLKTAARMGEATLLVQVNLSAPTALAMGEAPFDVFTFRSGNRGHEIHGAKYTGSALMQTSLFGTGDDGSTLARHFVDGGGLPFRLELPIDAAYPAEGEAISSLYPAILNFAASGGTQDKDFYQSQVVTAFAYTDSQGLGAPSPVFTGGDAHSVNTACVGAYSGDCADYAILGFATQDACLRDGLWHDLGQYSGGVGMPAPDLMTLDGLAKAGADFKVMYPGTDRSVINVDRVIPDCNLAGGTCFYARREYGTGLAAFGLYIYPDSTNGRFWIGAANDPFDLNTYFTGTTGNITTGTMDYKVMVRPAGWRNLGTFTGGQAIAQAPFDEIRALAERGADFKVMIATGTDHHLLHQVVRIIPRSSCGADCMWFYATREASDGGERTLGMAVTRQTSGGLGLVNGDYWIGSAVGITSLGAFFGGTTTNHGSGRIQSFTLYVNDDLNAGTPAYSNNCANALSLGWASVTACLADGRWHHLGSFGGGQGNNAADQARIDALVASGADFKLRNMASNAAIIPIERYVPNPGGQGGHWFYARREHGTGLATIGFNVMPTAANGTYWIGSAIPQTSVTTFFTGTNGSLASGSFTYDLYAKAGRWRQIAQSGGSAPLDSATFDEIRTLAHRGASFKISATSLTYGAVHRVVRVIPDGGGNKIYVYAKRESNDNGERTLGMTVSMSSDNGNFWMGSPLNISTLQDFYTGTGGSVQSGTIHYRLFVED